MTAVAHPVGVWARPPAAPAARRPGCRRRPASAARRGRQTKAVYRRRRLAAAVVALGVLLSGSSLLARLGDGPLTAPEPVPEGLVPVARRSEMVEAGDTIWAIARALQPEGDVRPLVDRLASAHQGGLRLRPGERLPWPASP